MKTIRSTSKISLLFLCSFMIGAYAPSVVPFWIMRAVETIGNVPGYITTDDTSPRIENAPMPADPRKITMVFGGDVMLARGVESVIRDTAGGDYTWPWANIAPYLKRADIACVNLESQISERGKPDLTRISGPWFAAKDQAVQGLVHAGIDMVTVANNHCFDYGPDSLTNSLENLRQAGIKYSGIGSYDEAYAPVYLTVKDKKVAFLAYTNQVYPWYRATKGFKHQIGISWPAKDGAAWLSYDNLDKGIARAKNDGANIIVVSMHFGVEYDTTPSLAQELFTRHAIDQGAHIVIGHGPHIVQPVIVYKHGIIAYSLGNLIFDLQESRHPGVSRGMLLEIDWENGAITKVTPRYTRNNEATCQPDFETAALSCGTRSGWLPILSLLPRSHGISHKPAV
ncbi:MAG: CapA family protein [Syntrophaceae bacterium]